jgi:glycosyltransferase involved in cell wall biosynthesis
VRICSNIPPIDADDPTAELVAAGHPVGPATVLFFGSGHPSVLFDYVEAALRKLLEVQADVELVILGMDAQHLYRLRPSLAQLGASVRTLGYVPAQEVSLWLQASQLVLAPLIEGVNARKGTVMAAFQHACAVVTTHGTHTADDIPWDQICALAPVDRDAFAALSVECFHDPGRRARLGQAARTEYEAQASASVTAAQLLSLAVGSKR